MSHKPPSFPFHLVDLTHSLHPQIASWNGACGFHHTVKLDYSACPGDVKFRVHKLHMHAGIGTHMDAPSHCVEGGETIGEIPLSSLACPAIVIDVSSRMRENYQVSPEDIQLFEQQHGPIPSHAFVIFHTGWECFWHDPVRYRNNLVFPSISKESALFLLEKNINGLGIDTLSPDCPKNGFLVHQIILGSGKYIVENVAHAKQLPPTGAFSLALPMKIHEGTEAPLRLIGLLRESKI